jgi:serine/threonine-protein kinase
VSETYDRTLGRHLRSAGRHRAVRRQGAAAHIARRRGDSQASGEARAEVARAAQGRATDPEAHRLLLLARHLLNRRVREDAVKAIDYLKQALTRDSNFALGWAELSRAYSRQADQGWVPVAEGYGHAREAAQRALVLEPNLAEGHSRSGGSRW